MSGTADVVVVGAGILGAATAHALATADRSVVVLERGSANREGSGTTAGNLHIQAVHTRRPGQQVPLDNVRFLPLQAAASRLWTDVPAELDADVELRRSGGLMVAESAADEAELRAKLGHEAAHGIRTELLDGEAARSMLPLLGPTVRAATWCADDGYANPLKVTPAYLAAARRAGVRVLEDAAVTGLRASRAGWDVDTADGRWSAGAVVVTAGPWIQQVVRLAGAEVAASPVAIQMHVTVRLPPVLPHLVQHMSEGLSVKQVQAGQVLIGGGWPAARLEPDGRSPVSVRSVLGNVAQAVRLLPFLSDVALLRAWAGPLAATPDEMPVVGEVPGCPGLFLAGGTYAFTFAPLWGRVLRDLVLGRAPQVEVADLGVDRLMTGGAGRVA
ncbi:NAD(P)/FAD-dependent oxidoreductase [Modestobacter versicolor]|uniref:NAD(P)/FAD-dependent oxidoreductase n=1 Tax=Modestobacter versicolor TaxID=429133 RepID=UPI0034DEF695